jgi:uncharacterized protein (TIGR01777 family)
MNILMTGATGLVGTALVQAFTAEGHVIYRLVRPGSTLKETISGVFDIPWNPAQGENLDLTNTDLRQVVLPNNNIDAVINLAGAPIANGRWSAKRKALLRSSRIDTTRGLVRAMANMSPRPRVFISASAIGYYGDRGDEVLTENSAQGSDFLATLAKEWEDEAVKAEQFGLRVVVARLGVVLAKTGGALPQMMMPFRFGLGGKLGSGRQWMSWIALEDVVAIIRTTLATDSLKGALNLVSPEPVRNADFTRSLARALHRPAIFAAPAFALRLAMGEMSEMILSSTRVTPQVLLQHGYQFRHTQLDEALRAILA